MIPLIQRALVMGYTAKTVLDFIGTKLPNMGDNVSNARNRGYSDDDILKFIQGKIPLNKPQQKDASDMDKHLSNIGFKTQEQRKYDKGKALKGILGVGIAGLGAYQAYKNYSGFFSQNEPEQPQPISSRPEEIEGSEADEKIQTKTSSSDILDQLNIKDTVETMAEAGNSPDLISTALSSRLSSDQQKLLKENAPQGLSQIITEYIALKGEGQPQESPEALQEMQQAQADIQEVPEEALQEIPEPEEELEEIKKGSTIMTPKGEIGTIEELPGKIAKIKVGDKTEIQETDRLTNLPYPEKDMADLYEDLIKGIETETGQEISRNVYWAGYDPEANELSYIPHSGKLYVYGDIDEEIASQLTSLMSQRKTTGQNYIGGWTEGTKSPIGVKMSQLIQRLQKERGGKGSEYKNRFDVVYDAFEPAKEALKKRKKEEKNREKKTKKPKAS